MALLNIFRNPKPRQFDYKPMYYDAEKEEREALLRAASAAGAEDTSPEAMKARIQQGFRMRRQPVDRGYRRRYERRSNRLVIAIAVVLSVFAMYLIFKYGALIAA